jgi:hypothetical protein
MKTPDESIRELVSNLHDETSAETDRRILADVMAVMDRKRNVSRALHRQDFRDQFMRMMHSRLFRFASATVLVLALILPFLLLNSSTTRAYALEDTLNAIDRLKTVHMAGEFYQGNFECWMQFDDNPDKPAYLWLVIPRIPNLQRVCTPELSFAFNPRTKALFECRRDERKQAWIIRFGSFFKEILAAAKTENAATIGTETDPQTGKELIAVHLQSKTREQKFLVDPATKLPVKFITLRDDAPQESMKRGLAIRNLDWIRYNEPVPKGLFDVAAGATVVSEEPDVLATPENGLDSAGMSREDACRALVERMGQAAIEGDVAKIRQCAPFFWVVKDEVFAQARATAEKTGRIPVEVTVQGKAYQEGDHWFIPCVLRNRNGSREASTAMIKFYRFGDQERCTIIGTKEKGVYD